MSKTIFLCACLTGLMGVNSTSNPPQDLTERVEALEKALEEAKVEQAATAAVVAKEAEKLRQVEAWLATLPKSLDALSSKMDSARKNGFEYAGPNPRAKKDVLDGIKAFSAELKKALPKAPAAKIVKKKRGGRR